MGRRDVGSVAGIIAAIVGVVLLAVLSLIVYSVLWPKPLTFERFQSGFTREGLSVANVTPIVPPRRGSSGQVWMTVNGTPVTIFHYNTRKALEGHFDTGDLDDILAPKGFRHSARRRLPTAVGANENFLAMVSSDDEALRGRIMRAFESR